VAIFVFNGRKVVYFASLNLTLHFQWKLYVYVEQYPSKLWKQWCLTSSVDISHFYYTAIDIKRNSDDIRANAPWYSWNIAHLALSCDHSLVVDNKWNWEHHLNFYLLTWVKFACSDGKRWTLYILCRINYFISKIWYLFLYIIIPELLLHKLNGPYF
jgi:hypothetical protein